MDHAPIWDHFCVMLDEARQLEEKGKLGECAEQCRKLIMNKLCPVNHCIQALVVIGWCVHDPHTSSFCYRVGDRLWREARATVSEEDLVKVGQFEELRVVLDNLHDMITANFADTDFWSGDVEEDDEDKIDTDGVNRAAITVALASREEWDEDALEDLKAELLEPLCELPAEVLAAEKDGNAKQESRVRETVRAVQEKSSQRADRTPGAQEKHQSDSAVDRSKRGGSCRWKAGRGRLAQKTNLTDLRKLQQKRALGCD